MGEDALNGLLVPNATTHRASSSMVQLQFTKLSLPNLNLAARATMRMAVLFTFKFAICEPPSSFLVLLVV